MQKLGVFGTSKVSVVVIQVVVIVNFLQNVDFVMVGVVPFEIHFSESAKLVKVPSTEIYRKEVLSEAELEIPFEMVGFVGEEIEVVGGITTVRVVLSQTNVVIVIPIVPIKQVVVKIICL